MIFHRFVTNYVGVYEYTYSYWLSEHHICDITNAKWYSCCSVNKCITVNHKPLFLYIERFTKILLTQIDAARLCSSFVYKTHSLLTVYVYNSRKQRQGNCDIILSLSNACVKNKRKRDIVNKTSHGKASQNQERFELGKNKTLLC